MKKRQKRIAAVIIALSMLAASPGIPAGVLAERWENMAGMCGYIAKSAEDRYAFAESSLEETGTAESQNFAEMQVEAELGGAMMLAATVFADYQEAAWNGSEVTYTGKTETCTPVESSAGAVTWDAGWYVVNGSVTISEPITVTGAVNLILADGCILNAEKGIVVETGNSLTIYAQSGGTGTLNATGADSAGIGGAGRTDYGVDGGSSGAITIHGGNITATSQNGAGIGGGAPWSGAKGGSGSNITIYGGSVTASSSRNGMGGAGIGGGGGDTGGGTGEKINIYGGTVNATGGTQGAGIGGGGSGIGKKSGDGSGITISGGTVTAVGGQYAAGIGGGGGYYSSYTWGGTTSSSGCTGGTGSVTISGGIVDASSPTDVSISDYKGAPIGNGGNTTATATVNKITGIVFENGEGTVCGDVTLDGSYTLPADYTLNIPAGGSLSGSGTLSGGSAFTTENLTADMISVPTDLYYTGKDRTEDITTELSGELTKGVTICGQTFTVSGWTLAVEKTGDLTYTATYTNNNDSTKTFTKTITLLKSGTKFEGDVKTYNGDTQTTTFNADDTITVKATPTATGAAPQKAAARLRGSYTEPTAGQMALFVGDVQVSKPVQVGADGIYTMTVSAAEVLLQGNAEQNGNAITLTAKFVGNDNMADAAGTVDVKISAVAMAEKDSTVIGYYGESNLADAFADSGNAGATITLLSDVEPSTYLTIQIDCTLDLGGRTITSGIGRGQCVNVQTNTAVTIRGEGEIIAKGGIALAVSGSVTLEGGTYTSGGDESSSVYVMGQSAMLSVTGEKVSIRNISGGYGLSVAQAQSVRLSAGTYSGTTEAISSTVKLSDMLAHTDNIRYAYYQGDALVTTGLDGQALTGTVTVKACTHTYQYAHTTGTTTHSQTCPACGDAKASEKCDFSNGPCPCGAVLAVKLTADLNLTYNGTVQEPGVTVTVNGTPLTEGYSVAYNNNINAGNAAAVTVTGTSFTGTATLTFSIGKATPTITWSSATRELTYTGQQAVITAPTVTLENNENFGGTISYSYKKQGETDYKDGLPTDAGTYTVKAHVDAAGNYAAADSTNELALTIKKADAVITIGTDTYHKTFGDVAFTLDVTDNNTEADAQYEVTQGTNVVSVENGTVTIKNAGTAAITVSLPATANYNAAENKTMTINVAKADAPPVENVVKQYIHTKGSSGETDALDVAGKLPADRGNTNYTLGSPVGSSILSDAAVDENGKLTYKVEAGTAGSTASITVTAKMANYEDTAFTLEIRLVDVIQVEITAKAEDSVYDGSRHKGYADGITCGYPVAGYAFSYTGREGTAYDSSEPPVDAGSYTVTISVSDQSGDYEGAVPLAFIIDKASITIKADDKTAEKGDPLPELTYTASGLAEKDRLAAAPELACAADMKTEGSYPIIVSGAKVPDIKNYQEEITYKNGTLTVLDSAVHVTGVSLDKSALSLSAGSTGRLTAVLSPENATDKSVSWVSGNPAVASVDSSGNVTAVSAGTAVITVTAADGGHTASCTVTVRNGTGSSGSGGSGGTGSSGGSGSPGSTGSPGGGSTGSPGSGTGTASKQPFIKDSSGREGWDVIRAEAEKTAAASAGGTVDVYMNGAVSVPGSVFAAVRGKDVILRFDMGSGITWSVDGRDVTAETAVDTDFSVKADAGAVPEGLIAEKAGGLAHLELSLAHEGAFGFTAVLTVRIVSRDANGITVGSSGTAAEYTGMYANLFYYNPGHRSLEFICAGQIREDGTADLPFMHASDYTVILSAYPMGGTDTPETPQEPAETEKPQEPVKQAGVKSVKLSKTLYTYNGKPKKPSVTAVDTEGRKISGRYYTVSYKNNKKAGKAAAIVKFKGGYSGTVKKTFTIRPAGTSIKKLTAASGGFAVKWKKKTAQTSGYQIQYSTSAGFKGNSTRSVFVKKASVTEQTVKNLKAGRKYYVRIRTYKTVNADGKNTKVYSAWSGAVRVRTLPASGGEKTAYSARARDFIAAEREDGRKREA